MTSTDAYEFDPLDEIVDDEELDRLDPDGDQLDLAERHALRRVPGLSTELLDVTEVEYRQLRLERVVLVGVWTSGIGTAEAENSMHELRRLAETAGALVLDGFVQRRDRPDPATYVGSGKAKALREVIVATGADTLVCDGELTPSQLVQLEKIVQVKVIDRTALILDIFAQHAKSREGKAQVELAQLQYMLPRLRGWGQSMSRQGGGRVAGGAGIGGRGPGETKIETDRRRIRTRTARLRREITEMGTARATQRTERRRHAIASVAIVGYTNAGKSSLLNRITGAGVLVENALFATLDPTVRRAETPYGQSFTLTDTVGFVRHLPHQLVEAFRSTLEEIAQADLILHIVDGSDDEPEAQLSAVRAVLAEIEARDVREIVVVNKADAAQPAVLERLVRREPTAVVVSARTGVGIEGLLSAIAAAIPRPDVEVNVLVPYEHGGLVARVHEHGDVLVQEYTGEGTRLRARVGDALAAELAPFAAAT
ncbi:MAG TPA: GTPase HflX [Sporichthyaceae bacterium]|jgi:GTP-binding protein HflX|nr:GTPase HflX [Sporichthyaceae bacterium]